MLKRFAFVAGLTLLFGVVFVPSAHAQTRFSLQIGPAAPFYGAQVRGRVTSGNGATTRGPAMTIAGCQADGSARTMVAAIGRANGPSILATSPKWPWRTPLVIGWRPPIVAAIFSKSAVTS